MANLADANYTPSVTTFTQTAGGTAQVLVAGNNARQALFIQPITEAIVINFGLTAGVQATGTYTLAANPTNLDTLAFNGTTFTFVTGASTSTNIHIGDDEAETLAEAIVVLNASVTAGVAAATYTTDGATIITITYDAGGTDGNAYTLGTSGGNVTRSAATLAGGSDTVGGIPIAAGQPMSFDASQYPSVKNDVYIVSATNSAKTAYLEGFGG